jgi:hypothetical protein
MITLEVIESFAEKNQWLHVERILGQTGYLLPSGNTIRFVVDETTHEIVRIIDVTNCALNVDKPDGIEVSKDEEESQ